jgi:hypothetical protein
MVYILGISIPVDYFMTDKAQQVKCMRCRGLGQIAWLGGVMRDCPGCNGAGKVPGIETKKEPEPIIPTIEPAANAAEDTVVPVELDVIPTVAIPTPLAEVPKQVDNKGREIIFPGYDNDLMEAVLAEPKMTTQEWKERYKRIAGVVEMGLRERAAIREMYAMSKPPAPRKVDLMASQDKVAVGDPEYQKQLRKEQLKEKAK